jgi:hypothetical protein
VIALRSTRNFQLHGWNHTATYGRNARRPDVERG